MISPLGSVFIIVHSFLDMATAGWDYKNLVTATAIKISLGLRRRHKHYPKQEGFNKNM